MKRLTLLLILLTVGGATFYFTSCTKEQVYSCNEGINTYVSKYKNQFQHISRNDLTRIGIDTQFAIINCLSPENNARILKEKLNWLLNDGSTNDKDKQHLQKLYAYVSPAIYEKKQPDQDTFLKNWRAYAENDLGWDAKKMAIFVGTWLIPSEIEALKTPKRGQSAKRSAIVDDPIGEQNSCNCTAGYLCETVYDRTCVNNDCKKTTSGCGFLWTQQCWGTCS